MWFESWFECGHLTENLTLWYVSELHDGHIVLLD
jgi:hypothetical protein